MHLIRIRINSYFKVRCALYLLLFSGVLATTIGVTVLFMAVNSQASFGLKAVGGLFLAAGNYCWNSCDSICHRFFNFSSFCCVMHLHFLIFQKDFKMSHLAKIFQVKTGDRPKLLLCHTRFFVFES